MGWSMEMVGILVLWLFLFGYLIVASIDFGAGFFSFYSVVTNKKQLLHGMIEQYLNPVWEVTNVFLIFFMIGIIGFFPDTAYYLGTSLLIPGTIFLILLSIRGAYYAFNTYGHRHRPGFMMLYGISGLLIPASLSVVLTISEGGFIVEENGTVRLLLTKLLTSPYHWAMIVLAICSVLFISSSFLSFYASRAKNEQAEQVMRSYALRLSLPTILSGFLLIAVSSKQNPELFAHLMNQSWLFGVSLLCFLCSCWLQWRKNRPGLAFLLLMLQYGLAFFGYGAARLPYIVYPYVTLHDSMTNATMGTALIIVFIAGLCVLIPSLILLLRLFLFNAKYVENQP